MAKQTPAQQSEFSRSRPSAAAPATKQPDGQIFAFVAAQITF